MATPHVIASSSPHPSQSSTSNGIVGSPLSCWKENCGRDRLVSCSKVCITCSLYSTFLVAACYPNPRFKPLATYPLAASMGRLLGPLGAVRPNTTFRATFLLCMLALWCCAVPSIIAVIAVIVPLKLIIRDAGTKMLSNTPVAIKFVGQLTTPCLLSPTHSSPGTS